MIKVSSSPPRANPTVSQSVIDTAYIEDPASARVEWGAEFRSDVQALLTLEALAAVVPEGVRELPPDLTRSAYGHFDGATGSGDDAAAAAVAVKGEDVAELAAVRQWRTTPRNGRQNTARRWLKS